MPGSGSSFRPPELSAEVQEILRDPLHSTCGRPWSEHPGGIVALCRFPALPPVEFGTIAAGPVVRVCGIPDPANLPRPVLELLDQLAYAIREHYALGVEVEVEGEREAAQLAVETLRRYLA